MFKSLSTREYLRTTGCHWKQLVSPASAHACIASTRRRVTHITRSQPEGRRSTSTTVTETPPVQAQSAAASTSAALKPTAEQEHWRWEESSDALLAYGVLAGVLLLGAVDTPLLRGDNNSDLLYFLSLAVCTQYIGAHRGLTTSQRQQISIKEGLLAPVLASVSLFSCYLLIKFFPQLDIATLLNGYFWLLGSIAAVGAFGPTLRHVGGPLGRKSLGFDVPDGWLVDEKGKAVTRAEFAPTDILALGAALWLSTANFATPGNFTFNNALACLIASDILQLIGIRSFRVAGLLLVGLLVYDVFWVFASPQVVGDNVMLAVATSDLITGPTRLLFPRLPGGMGEAADYPFSLLGLGDVAVPGLLACLALRYDASRTVDMRGRALAAASAITGALAALDPATTTSRQMGRTAAQAAEEAYDRFADQDHNARNQTLDGTNEGQSPVPNNSGTNGKTGQTAGEQEQQQQQQQQQPVRRYATEAVLQQRTYFTPVMVAYVAGLLTAFAANSITGLGQVRERKAFHAEVVLLVSALTL